MQSFRATSTPVQINDLTDTDIRNIKVFEALRVRDLCYQDLIQIDPYFKKYGSKLVEKKFDHKDVLFRAPLLKDWNISLGKRTCDCGKQNCKKYFLKDRIKQSPKIQDNSYHTKGCLKKLFPIGWKNKFKEQMDQWKEEPFDYEDYEALWELDPTEVVLISISDEIYKGKF